MSVGDFFYKLGTLGHSPLREAEEQKRKNREKLEELDFLRQKYDQEYNNTLRAIGLEGKLASNVAGIAEDRADRAATRQIGTNDANAKILTRLIQPAITQSTIAIDSNKYDQQGKLITTAADASRGILRDGITYRSNAAKDFFPLVTDQIAKLQDPSLRLAMRAIEGQETMADKDRALVKELWHLQNPKLGFGQRFANAAPGLAAAALLAFS